LYGDSKEVRVMAGNGNDRHDTYTVPSTKTAQSPTRWKLVKTHMNMLVHRERQSRPGKQLWIQ
jgi:hypothetical protein